MAVIDVTHLARRGGGYVPIGLAIIILITPEDKVPWAMGFISSLHGYGPRFGPLMGGLAADLLGYRAPFIMFSALTGLCMLGILSIHA